MFAANSPVGGKLAQGKALTLPCGRCIGCRLERARQWAVRMVHECQMHEESSFLTLTYDDAHIPLVENSSGEKVGTLCKKDAQAFIKALRKKIDPVKVRFFLCGEYGDKLSRPHYHVMLFGYAFPDRVPLSSLDSKLLGGRGRAHGKYPTYYSAELESVWKRGICTVQDVSFDSAAYVASYTCKKVNTKKSYVDGSGRYWPSAKEFYDGREPEFANMSRRRGIGYSWIEHYNPEVYPSDEIITKGRPCKPPRFYDEFIKELRPEVFREVEAEREKQGERLEEANRCGKRMVSRAVNSVRLRAKEDVCKKRSSMKIRNLEE